MQAEGCPHGSDSCPQGQGWVHGRFLVPPVGHPSAPPGSPASVTWRHPARSPPFRYVWLFLSFQCLLWAQDLSWGQDGPTPHADGGWGPDPVSLLKAESSKATLFPDTTGELCLPPAAPPLSWSMWRTELGGCHGHSLCPQPLPQKEKA